VPVWLIRQDCLYRILEAIFKICMC
jgi:hypothetical protein